MKKLFLMLGITAVSVLMTSCAATYKTATSRDVNSSIYTHTVADLEVSPQKISYTFYVGSDYKKTSQENIVNAAVSAALEANGGADVLVGLETTIRAKGLGKKIQSVVVTGYPAKYVNFRNDPVQHVETCASYRQTKSSVKGKKPLIGLSF